MRVSLHQARRHEINEHPDPWHHMAPGWPQQVQFTRGVHVVIEHPSQVTAGDCAAYRMVRQVGDALAADGETQARLDRVADHRLWQFGGGRQATQRPVLDPPTAGEAVLQAAMLKQVFGQLWGAVCGQIGR